MTTAWHLTTDPPIHGIRAADVMDRARALGPNLSTSLRLNERGSSEVRFYEAFVGGGALSSVYQSLKHKRAVLEDDVRWVSLALVESGRRVGLLHAHEGAPLPERWGPGGGRRTLHEVLELLHGGTLGWWEIDLGGIRFLFEGVEARLFSPIAFGQSGIAIGFFASFEVVAQSTADAVAELRRSIADDEGAWVAAAPAPQALGLDAANSRCRRVGGRAYFV